MPSIEDVIVAAGRLFREVSERQIDPENKMTFGPQIVSNLNEAERRFINKLWEILEL